VVPILAIVMPWAMIAVLDMRNLQKNGPDGPQSDVC